MNSHPSIEPDSFFICGIDEVGRGPLAGPVTAAAVILHKNTKIEGLDDSKKLSPGKREELFPQILKSSITAGVGFVDPVVIDKFGINYATFLAMYRAILRLSIMPDWIMVDGEPIPELPIAQTAIKKGDSLCPVISAASIIAKVMRDRVMEFFDILYPEYGFCHHKGYGTEMHLKNLKFRGSTCIHRKSFHPLDEIQR